MQPFNSQIFISLLILFYSIYFFNTYSSNMVTHIPAEIIENHILKALRDENAFKAHCNLCMTTKKWAGFYQTEEGEPKELTTNAKNYWQKWEGYKKLNHIHYITHWKATLHKKMRPILDYLDKTFYEHVQSFFDLETGHYSSTTEEDVATAIKELILNIEYVNLNIKGPAWEGRRSPEWSLKQVGVSLLNKALALNNWEVVELLVEKGCPITIEEINFIIYWNDCFFSSEQIKSGECTRKLDRLIDKANLDTLRKSCVAKFSNQKDVMYDGIDNFCFIDTWKKLLALQKEEEFIINADVIVAANMVVNLENRYSRLRDHDIRNAAQEILNRLKERVKEWQDLSIERDNSANVVTPPVFQKMYNILNKYFLWGTVSFLLLYLVYKSDFISIFQQRSYKLC